MRRPIKHVSITQRMKAGRIVKRLRDQYSLDAVSRFFGIPIRYVITAENMTKRYDYGRGLEYFCPHWAIDKILKTDIMRADIGGMRPGVGANIGC